MKRGIWIWIVLTVLTAMIFPAGCSKPESEEETTIVQPMEQYEREATDQITAENAEAELDKLEREIGSDVAAE